MWNKQEKNISENSRKELIYNWLTMMQHIYEPVEKKEIQINTEEYLAFAY